MPETNDKAIRALVNEGIAHQELQQWDEAESICLRIASLCADSGDKAGEGQALAFIAHMREKRGDVAGAADYGTRILALAQK